MFENYFSNRNKKKKTFTYLLRKTNHLAAIKAQKKQVTVEEIKIFFCLSNMILPKVKYE